MTTSSSVDMEALLSVTKKLEETFREINMQLERYLADRRRSYLQDNITQSVDLSTRKTIGETRFSEKGLMRNHPDGHSESMKRRMMETQIQLKSPMNPFFMFLLEKKEKTRLENPNLKITEVSALIGEFWNKMSQEQKRPYKEQYYRQKDLFKQSRSRGPINRSKK